MQVPHGLVEAMVSRSPQNHRVEQVVGRRPLGVRELTRSFARRGEARDSLAEQRSRLAELAELVIRYQLGRQLHPKPFELRPNHVSLADVAWGWAADCRAAPRKDLKHAGRLELPQCLADRRPADTEFLGERLLAKSSAQRQLAGHDLEMDSLGELVDERLTSQASRLGHRRHGPNRTVRRSGPGTHRAPCFRAIRSVAAWSVWSLGTSTPATPGELDHRTGQRIELELLARSEVL